MMLKVTLYPKGLSNETSFLNRNLVVLGVTNMFSEEVAQIL